MIDYIYPIENIDLFFSSQCNLNCSYCYVGRESKHHNQFNNDIKKSIENGEFAKNIKNNFKDFQETVYSFGCWGGEPTLNYEVFYTLFKDLLEYFYNVRTIFFSTNGTLGIEKLKYFIDAIIQLSKDFNKELKLGIQFSIDGPEWITDKERGKNVTNKCVQTLEDTLLYLSDIKYNKVKFEINLKPTLNIDTIRQLVNNETLLYDYFLFFDEIWEKNKTYCHNENVDACLKAAPTFVSPGKYTQEDGKTYAKFIHNISELDESKFKNYRHPFIRQGFNNINCVLNRRQHFDFLNTLGSCACGAGLGSYSADCYGNVYPCHRYFSESVKMQDNMKRECEKYTTILSKNKEERKDKIKLINAAYENNAKSRKSFFDIICSALAKYGQIDEDYLTDGVKRTVLFYLIGEFLCHFGQSDETKDLFIATTDYIKLFGNGALEEMIKYGVKTGEIEYVNF